jgi:hypothetical protein
MYRREFRSDALLPWVGEIVFVEDIDDDRGWYISSCTWHTNGRVSADRFIAIVAPTIITPGAQGI